MESPPWQEEFQCLLGALLHIAALVHERTLVTLFDECGAAFEERIVVPNNEVHVPGENRTRISIPP